VFTAVLAKHSKSFSLIDCISVGVDRMQRNFEPMRKQVEAWQRSELTDVTAKVVIYLLQEPVYQGRDWILIGHSMGGLVCRVANCILRDQDFSSKALPLARSLGYASAEILEIQQYQFGVHSVRPVSALVTLATPNSGALLQGQVSGVAALTQKMLNIFPLTQVSSGADLTTERLFQILQYEAVDNPVRSMSGSKWNRFATASGQITRWLGLSGIQLDMPHDSIVEDRSVNLSSSILPNEVVHQGVSPHMHLRVYEGCSDVTHTNIYDDPKVRNYLADFLVHC